MEMAVPREKWTDDRLDELSTKVNDGFARADKKMDAGFARVDGDIRELKGEMNQRFEKVDQRFDKVEGKIESLDSKFDTKFDGLNKTLLGAAVSVIVTLIVCCATLIGVAVL
jgi:hypothetical protein